jgi:hypothetical protein
VKQYVTASLPRNVIMAISEFVSFSWARQGRGSTALLESGAMYFDKPDAA